MKDNFFLKNKTCLKTTWKFRILMFFLVMFFLVISKNSWLAGLYNFLTPSMEMEKVDAILIEGWNYDLQIRHAVDLFQKGYGNLLMTTGFEIVKFSECYPEGTLAEVTKEQIIRMGVDKSLVIPIIQPNRGTYNEAVAAKAYFDQYKIKSIMIVTTAGHMKRTYLTFKKVYGESLRIIPVPVPEKWFLKNNWWETHTGLEFLVSEYSKLFYYWIKGYI